jgi:hypothetical protein
MKWDELTLDQLHIIAKDAIEWCIQVNSTLAHRFSNLKSTVLLDQFDERRWLIGLFDSWFTRKWNDRRRQAAKGPRIRGGPHTCRECGAELCCVQCHRLKAGVFSDIGWKPANLQNQTLQHVPEDPPVVLESSSGHPSNPSNPSADPSPIPEVNMSQGADMSPQVELNSDASAGHQKDSATMFADEDNIITISSDDEEPTALEPEEIAEDKLEYGTAFEKIEDYDRYLDEPNPWHPHLKRELFPAQIIGFRWMADRHNKGGAIIGDKVGCGKVFYFINSLIHTDFPSCFILAMVENARR